MPDTDVIGDQIPAQWKLLWNLGQKQNSNHGLTEEFSVWSLTSVGP